MNNDSTTAFRSDAAEMIFIVVNFIIIIAVSCFLVVEAIKRTFCCFLTVVTTKPTTLAQSPNAQGYRTPPRTRKKQNVPKAPRKVNWRAEADAQAAEADTQVVQGILGVICPSLLLDSTKMKEAIEKSVTRSPSGRIIRLNTLKLRPSILWRLPTTITQLDCLEELDLFFCTRIPLELATMRSLKHIQISAFSLNQIDFPVVNFPYLQSFSLDGLDDIITVTIPGRALTSMVQFIGHRLTNLTCLSISSCRQLVTAMLADLTAISSEQGFLGFRKTLRVLRFTRCGITESDLLLFLRHAANLIPNITTIGVPNNQITSLQMVGDEIAKLIASNSPHTTLPHLCSLDIVNNPVVKKFIKSRAEPVDTEDEAILSLLWSFPRLISFLPRFGTNNDTKDLIGSPYASPEVEAFLRLRSTKTHYFLGEDKTTSNTSQEIHPQAQMRYPISMKLWPQALQTSYRLSDFRLLEYCDQKDATGVYHMLRYGPALVGRTHLFADIDNEKKKNFENRQAINEA